MKRKALLKTVIDIFKFLIGAVVVLITTFTGFYLFLFIPLWLLEYFNLLEKFADYPVGYIYIPELLIIFAIIFVVHVVRLLYNSNLDKISHKEKR